MHLTIEIKVIQDDVRYVMDHYKEGLFLVKTSGGTLEDELLLVYRYGGILMYWSFPPLGDFFHLVENYGESIINDPDSDCLVGSEKIDKQEINGVVSQDFVLKLIDAVKK